MAQELGHELQPLEEVRATILSHLSPLAAETCPLLDAYGRVLREEVVATSAVPPFDNSAMDGFAVQVADLAGASEAEPVRLRVQAALAAGDVPVSGLVPGATVRIMTGAPIPPGTEAVVPHELTRFDEEFVTFFKPVQPGQNIRRAGGDLKPGEVPLRPGRVLRGPQLAIAASLGVSTVRVTRSLRVGILSPGNELVEFSRDCPPGKIRNSNALSLDGALREAGAHPVHLGIVPDNEKAILDAVEGGFADGLDAIVSTGGASAGDYDFIKKVVLESAAPGYAFKVAMRPGKPQVFGLFSGRPLFGLPGNPAAAILSFEVLVRPALRRLRGEEVVLETPFPVRFPFPFRYRPGRVFLLRTRVEPETAGGSPGFRVVPPGGQDSSFLASLATANALVILPAERGEITAGEVMPALWLGGRP